MTYSVLIKMVYSYCILQLHKRVLWVRREAKIPIAGDNHERRMLSKTIGGRTENLFFFGAKLFTRW